MNKIDVLNYFGGPTKTARALGIKVGSVSGWPMVVPPLRQCQIEEVTRGALRKARDVYQLPTLSQLAAT